MKILLLDNYDSFTFNLVHLMESFPEVEVTVIRNDKIDLYERLEFDKLVLSPGPGLPSEAGQMMEVIKKYYQFKPILGVCLGHQAITEFFGGKLKNLEHVLHGVSTTITDFDKGEKLFKNFPGKFLAGHYHSWASDEDHFPAELKITSRNQDGIIMSLRHRRFDVCGIQFHPESILSEHGKLLMGNWLDS